MICLLKIIGAQVARREVGGVEAAVIVILSVDVMAAQLKLPLVADDNPYVAMKGLILIAISVGGRLIRGSRIVSVG